MAKYMHMHVRPESPMLPKPRYDARYLKDTPTGTNGPATMPWRPRARAILQQLCKETNLPASYAIMMYVLLICFHTCYSHACL